MGNILFNVTALGAIATIIVIAFCAGVLIPVFAKASVSTTGRFFGFVRRRAGHLASFAAGGALVALFTMQMNPYYFAMWSHGYEQMEVGRVILSNETIMETGKIPQTLIDWYEHRHPESKR